MRMVTFGIAAVFAALVLQLSDFGGREQSQKGQTQRRHYGCGLDVAVVDGQPASTKLTAPEALRYALLSNGYFGHWTDLLERTMRMPVEHLI